MNDTYKYGCCDDCGVELVPRWFKEKEYDSKTNCPTGRTRTAVDYLYCKSCLKKVCIDDTFDEEWRAR